MNHDPETIAIRDDERLPLDRLEPWLRANLAGAEGRLSLRQFGGGHANLTYLLSFDGGREFVLRRPPLGPVAPTSHDMRREHHVLSRLWRGYPLAPRGYVLCTDTSLIGAEFHVMERRHGFVLRGDLAGRVLCEPDLCRRVGHMIVDCLAALHLVDGAAAGLADLGRPEGFLRRQVDGWADRWNAAIDEPAPDATGLIAWLAANLPEGGSITLVHNDYKLDNILVARDDPARATAVLDWDMCTRGDPLADLGTLLNHWAEAGDPEPWRQAVSMATDRPGFPTRAGVAERYARRTGFDLARLVWYRVFAAFRTAVIIQQIYLRWLRVQTQDSRFAGFGARVRALIDKAESVAAV